MSSLTDWTSAEALSEAFNFHTLFSLTGLWAGFLILIGWILSYFFGWLIACLIRLVGSGCIEENEKRRNYMNNTHNLYSQEYPWCMNGLTKSRVRCYELIFGWSFFCFVVIGVLWAYQLMLIIMGTPFGLFFAYIIYRPNVSTLVASFIGRFRILWGDVIRVGESLTLTESSKSKDYRVIWIGVFDTAIVELNKRMGIVLEVKGMNKRYSRINTKPLPNYKMFIPEQVTLHPAIFFGNKSSV
jgi:hypothetical protein